MTPWIIWFDLKPGRELPPIESWFGIVGFSLYATVSLWFSLTVTTTIPSGRLKARFPPGVVVTDWLVVLMAFLIIWTIIAAVFALTNISYNRDIRWIGKRFIIILFLFLFLVFVLVQGRVGIHYVCSPEGCGQTFPLVGRILYTRSLAILTLVQGISIALVAEV